jgi:alkanesulfonate monooxygenase SsuD/methylene tetrahydromethanopterin reductase-like flavin-dependent oxidoreductase (luciferase family)
MGSGHFASDATRDGPRLFGSTQLNIRWTRRSWQGDGMQIGVVYPQIELGGDPAAVRRIGRATEELGFDHLLAYDHVLGAMHEDRIRPLVGPYTERDPFHDPLVMFGHVAAVTERIGFVTGILVLPQRQTALVARQAADVDLLSGGRLRLGVGIGWNHEYEALGENFGTRGAREEEQISLLRRLWTEPVVDLVGPSTASTAPPLLLSPRALSRSGRAATATPLTSGRLASATASASVAGPRTCSARGTGYASGSCSRAGPRRASAASTWS